MDKKEIEEIYQICLTWVPGDKKRAEKMLNAYLKGHNERDLKRKEQNDFQKVQ